MFVKTMNGTYYPVGRVERLWEEGSSSGSSNKAEIRDLGVVELFYGEVRRIIEETSPVIPNGGEFYVLQHVHEEDGSISLERAPVLGWALSPDRGVLPITIEGINNGADETVAVLIPSGQVVLALNRTYETENAYLEAVNNNG